VRATIVRVIALTRLSGGGVAKGGRVDSKGMLQAIGNTPLVKLRKLAPEGAAEVLVKLEYYNPTGSYKDRMALSMIERAEQRGTLKPGMTVVEYTGGSTGISLAFVCAVKGYRCRIVTNDAVALEKRRSMEIFGAELDVLKSTGGKLTADLVPRMMDRAREIASQGPSHTCCPRRSLGVRLVPQAVVNTTGAWSLVPMSASTTHPVARAATVGDAST
jgi:cysteine synthase